MLQQSWPKVKNSIFNNVFKQLMQKNSKAKELFQKMNIVEGFSAGKCSDIKEHVKMLTDLYDTSVQDLNRPSKPVQVSV
ncbi:CBN-GLB-3 protein [Aphelenchoides avenae]|nr:CBN-GLB-3 protein [Aphelenchus avenae]